VVKRPLTDLFAVGDKPAESATPSANDARVVNCALHDPTLSPCEIHALVTHDAHSQPHHPGVRSISRSLFGPLSLVLLSSILPAAYLFGEGGVIDLTLSGGQTEWRMRV
jgi:hypothetical protein